MRSMEKRRWIALTVCIVLVLSTIFSNGTLTRASENEDVLTEADEESAQEADGDAEEPSDQTAEGEFVDEQDSQDVSDVDSAAGADTSDNSGEEITNYEYHSQDVDVLVTLTDPADLPDDAKLIVTQVELTKDEQKSLEQAAIQAKRAVQDVLAYDIKFIQNGQEIQPGDTVNVKITTSEMKDKDDVQVYHIRDSKIENMQGKVTDKEEIVFDTTHFSKYIIVNQGDSEITATIEHYLDNGDGKEDTQLYKTKIVENIPVGDDCQLKGFTEENDSYELRSMNPVVIVDENNVETPVDDEEIIAVKDIKIRCYYTALKGEYVNGVTFFDYDVTDDSPVVKEFKENIQWYDIYIDGKDYHGNYVNGQLIDGNHLVTHTFVLDEKFTLWGDECTFIGDDKYSCASKNGGPRCGINSESNYTGGDENNRISVGQEKGYIYNINQNGESWNINVNNENKQPIIQGIVNGKLTGENYENVGFKPYEPGLFSKEPKIGKRILENYKMVFNRVGDVYTLEHVVNPEGGIAANDLNNFWPLDEDLGYDGLSSDSDDKGSHNWYFSTRYDFKFKLGDYMGGLNYSFTGDDDLWVYLDGELILDLGGMHSGYPLNNMMQEPGDKYDYSKWLEQYPNTIDLWDEIEGGKDCAQEYREKEHTITVLLMERGGYGSNCHMTFTMPNVEPVDPIITVNPKADLEFTKVDDAGNQLKGAEFTLYEEDGKTVVGNAVSKDDGRVVFSKLKEGTYVMKETKAPEGCVLSDKTWKVVVTVKDDKATAVLSDTSGNPVNQIVNYNINDKIKLKKAAELKDWDERLYTIDLYACLEANNNPSDGNPQKVTDVSIRDYIDPRFQIEDPGDGTVGKDENGSYVEWTKQELSSAEQVKKGWHKSIIIKAKPDFLGGNKIPTNGENSGVTVNGGELKAFNKPSVNVKLLPLDIENKSITLFLGDKITPQAYLKALIDTMNPSIIKLTPEQLTTLMPEGSLDLSYCYPGTEQVGMLKYSLEKTGSDGYGDHKADKIGDKVETYSISVQYVPFSIEQRDNYVKVENPTTDPDIESFDGEEVSKDAAVKGTYIVNVIAGTITVTKKIKVGDIDFSRGNPIFTLKITEKSGVVRYKTVEFTEDSIKGMEDEEYVSKSVTFTGLPRGVYTVGEESSLRYEMEELLISESSDNYDESAIYIGLKLDGKSQDNGFIQGAAEIKNKKNNNDYNSHTDVVTNQFRMEGGKIIITPTKETAIIKNSEVER